MKKIITFLFLIVISVSLFAQTDVSGSQSGIWTSANSPYLVIGDITVPAGEVLTIQPGVEVNFQGYYKLTVLGQLDAIGTETDSIFFTTDNQAIGWHGIRLGQSIGGSVTPADGISNFSYCRIEYGKTTNADYPDNHGGAIVMISSNAVLNNCVFADNTSLPGEGMGGAIYAINTGSVSETLTSFTNCSFLRNVGYSEGGAIKFTSDFNTEITNCQFIDNSTSYGGGAIMFYSVVDTKMTNCLFVNNSSSYANGGAIETLGSGNTLFFENCTMVDNEAVNGSGGAAALYYADVSFVNCIVYNNLSQYDDDNVYVDAGGGSATVNYCNIIMPQYNTTGTNNIETDPLFVDANNGDYHLQGISLCIDAGTDIGLPFVGTAPDMGCYEYGQINTPYVVTFSPNINEINVDLNATVTVTFNEDITVSDLSTIDIKDVSNVSVTGISAILEADNRTITISHSDFVENMVYTVIFPENSVENSDLVANNLESWSFTTKTIDNIDEQYSEIQVYPNPTSSYVHVQSFNSNIQNIVLMDLTGKILQNVSNPLASQTLDLGDYQSGVYFLRIETNNEIFVRKLIVK